MAIDVKTLTDDELDSLPDAIGREKSRRWNVVEAPKRVEELTTEIAKRPALVVTPQEDPVDGAWVQVDLSSLPDPDAAMKTLLAEGAQLVSISPPVVRHGARQFTKEGGHFDKLEAELP